MNHNSNIIYHGVMNELHSNLINGDILTCRGYKIVEVLNQSIHLRSDGGLINIFDIFYTKDDYLKKEIEWYESQNLNVGEIKKAASLWGEICDDREMINSNYGFLIYSAINGYQYKNVVRELTKDPFSRRAVMYYTNPHMHQQGGKDHICTIFVSFLIREGRLHCVVSMRSNDLIYGLIGANLGWHMHILKKLAKELKVGEGDIYWHAASMHIYEKHFDKLLKVYNEYFVKRREFNE